MLFFSASEKLAPPASPGEETGDFPATSPTPPTPPKLFTPPIIFTPTIAMMHSSSPWKLPSPSHSPHTPATPPAHSHTPPPGRYSDTKHTHPYSHPGDSADIPCE